MMDAVLSSGDSGFTHRMKRIWGAPQEEEKPAAVQTGNPETKENVQPEASREEPILNRIPVQPEKPKREPGYGSFENSTVISKGTVITGDVKSDGDIEMNGTVTGSISTSGKIRICGKQVGDIQGSSISLTASSIRGNISAAEDVTADSESVIVGDVKCGNLTLDGKLKGNIHVMGNVNCKGNAIVIGDITSTTVTIDSGAKLQGKVQISDGSIEQVDLPGDPEAGKLENKKQQ